MNAEPNIVVLQYAENNCYVNAISVEKARKKHPSFSVEIERNEWKFEEEKFKIGKRRNGLYDKSNRYGVIGVYHADSIEELDSMVHAVVEALESQGSVFDD